MVKGVVSVHQQLHYVLSSTARSDLRKQYILTSAAHQEVEVGKLCQKNPTTKQKKPAKGSSHHTSPNKILWKLSTEMAEFLHSLLWSALSDGVRASGHSETLTILRATFERDLLIIWVTSLQSTSRKNPEEYVYLLHIF